MPSVTTDNNIIVDRDYTDNFSIKDTAIKKLGQKYFEDVELSGLNVGALGFTLEQIANITEDAFNTSSILMNEAFPNKAIIPESIYSHAAIFQLDNTFSTCSKCTFIMLLMQEEILKFGKKNGSKISFYLDKRTVISVEGIPFTLDYDIQINAQKKQISGSESEYNFSAQYIIDSENSISDVNDPYLKIRKTPDGYLILQFSAHQVERTELTDTIISNTKINCPVIDFEFDGKLAGFDIFYKAPSDKSYTQLLKKLKFSLPSKTPFCFYTLKDENTLEITFSTRDGYFQPEFNSEIKIVLYTTMGKEGKFEVYTGSNIELEMNTETYDYNESLTISVKTVSDSSGGSDALSTEGLQSLTVEAYSTATEISTEHDIETYFYNYKYRYGNEMLVIKRRDDVTERLFSAFLLMKNDDYIYPTNTMHLDLTDEQFDLCEDDNRFTLKPGHTFIYKEGSNNTLQLIPDIMCYDKEKVEELMSIYTFVYTNPFLISMTKRPNLIGLYQTLMNQTAILDYISSNDNTFTQFITSKVTVKRGLSEKSVYEMSLSIIPSSSLDTYVTNLNTYEGNDVRVIAGFVGSNNEEVGYIELLPTAIDPNDNTAVTFSALLETDDHVTSNGLFSILNAVKVSEKADYMYIPISNVVVNIYILYDDALTTENRFSKYFPDMKYFVLTNIYSTKDDKLTFIKPMNMMRSTVTFSNIGTAENPVINSNISLLPVIKADIINNVDNFNMFIERLTGNYTYLESCLPILRNNTHIDIKFYNTYGKSNNYYIGDNGELIDRVNIVIKFKIIIVDGTDDVEILKQLKEFIKEFIEKVNSSGNNDLYISNLIREIETNFSSVHHLKFMGINDYSTEYQTISVRETELNNLSKEDRRNYVPEILVADKANILLSIETN